MARACTIPPLATRQAGYTLLETLVALSLTALLSMALFANVGMGARVWETVEDGSRQTITGQVLDRVLRRHIELAAPVTVTAAVGGQRVYFEGDGRTLRFLTEARVGALPPGIYGVKLSLTEGENGPALHLLRARATVAGFQASRGVAWDESRLPLSDRGAVFAYYGRPAGAEDAEWREEWSGQRLLPDLVRLSFAGGESAKTIIIAPVLDYSAARMSAEKFDAYFADVQG